MKGMTIISMLILSCAMVSGQIDSDSMRLQAEQFIENMPSDLQRNQNNAIRSAMAGDTTLLNEVRNSRNKAFDLPSDVMAKDLEPMYRLYTLKNDNDSIRPLLIYFHGGGWCFGSINSCAAFCTELVKNSGISVLAVEYPLAPEHPYPAPLNACTDAIIYACEHASQLGIDPARISVGGDSAGGNLALASALRMIYAQEQLKAQNLTNVLPAISSLVLLYPVVKVWNDDSESWKDYGTGYGLDAEIMETFNTAYLGGADPSIPLISPYNAANKHLSLLPPTLIINAEHDILHDQGAVMAQKMKEAGVEVQRVVFPGTTHLFITVPGQPDAFKNAVRLTSEFLNSQKGNFIH